MKIRGAPAIGVVSAYGMALGALKIEAKFRDEFLERLGGISQSIAATRPTAKNLFLSVERMQRIAESGKDVEQI